MYVEIVFDVMMSCMATSSLHAIGRVVKAKPNDPKHIKRLVKKANCTSVTEDMSFICRKSFNMMGSDQIDEYRSFGRI